jgi:polar amino acid transport system substrate-binding protein
MNTHRLKTIGALSAAAMTVAVSITACGGPTSASNASCTPKHSGIQTVTPGKLTVGVIDIPPYSSYNSGNPTGVDISIVSKIAKDECLAVSFEQASYADAIQSIGGNSIDLAVGSIAVTATREKVVDFSSSIYVESMGVTTRIGATTVAEVEKAGGKVGTVEGYNEIADLKKIFGDRLITYPSSVELKADFDNGRLVASFDAYGVSATEYKGVTGVTVALGTAKPDPRISALTRPPEDGFPLTKDNTSLKQALDDGITSQHQDGTIGKLLTGAGLTDALGNVSKTQYVSP